MKRSSTGLSRLRDANGQELLRGISPQYGIPGRARPWVTTRTDHHSWIWSFLVSSYRIPLVGNLESLGKFSMLN